MLVLHIIINLNSNGAELMLKRLISAQAPKGKYRHEVISLMSLGSVGPMLREMGIPVEALGMRSPIGAASVLIKLIREIRRRRPDIVHTWMYHSDLLGGIAAKIVGVKRVIWAVRIADISREMGIPNSTKWIRSLCARLSARIPSRIVYVAHSARAVHEALGYDPAKGTVIPNGYEIPRLAPRGALKAELNLPEESILIGSAGRFDPQKDPKSFVAAAAALAGRHPALHFVMIGLGNSPDNRELMGWIGETGFGDRFHLLGRRRDIATCLGGMDILCLHSIGEGFPNVVAEAMAVATPCVVTDVGDSAFLVGDTGLVVPASDHARLADALEELVNAGPERRRKLGAMARDRVARHFSIDVISDRYSELYDQVAAGETTVANAAGAETAKII